MSLAQKMKLQETGLARKMKLQELNVQIESLSSPRLELIKKQQVDAAEKIRKEVILFFTSKGFEIKGGTSHVIASYHGGLQTEIDFEYLLTDSFGSSGSVNFKYGNKKFAIDYLMDHGKLPRLGNIAGTAEFIEFHQIDFYENKLIPALKELGVSDLSGDFTIFSATYEAGNGRQRKKHESVEEILVELIC